MTGEGTFSVDISGNLTFQPDWNFSGIVTIPYTVEDYGNLVSNTALVKVTIIHTNIAPFAVDDTASTLENTPVTFNITNNDYDLDGPINSVYS